MIPLMSTAVVSLMTAGIGAPAAHATSSSGPTYVVASQATLVSQIAGLPGESVAGMGPTTAHPNDTATNYGFNSGDLAIPWDTGSSKVGLAFGDSFGAPWTESNQKDGHVCNAVAFSSNHDLNNGVHIDSMDVDSSGKFRAVVNCAGGEMSLIPTAAIHIGSYQYMGFMSVKAWAPTEGNWTTNNAGIAYSTDGGQTWTRSSTIWPNSGSTADFQQMAFADSGGYLYVFGTPNGRFGSAYVARISDASSYAAILNPSQYQYWTGSAWQTGGTPAIIVAKDVGELSVQYDSGLGVWMMTYLDEAANAIVLRTAPSPQGPWSPEDTLVSRASEPYPGAAFGLYGGFIHPWSSGSDLYFTVSLYGPYQTYLMHSTLRTFNGAFRATSAITGMPDGSSQILAIATDGTLYHEVLPTGSNPPAWTIIPDPTYPSLTFRARSASIAGMPDGSGSSQILAVGTDGVVYHNIRYSDGTWQGFQPITGGNGQPWQTPSAPSITGMPDGTSQVLLTATDGTLYHCVGTIVGGTWSCGSWTAVAGPSGATTFQVQGASIAGITDTSGTPQVTGSSQVIALGKDGVVYHDIRYADGTWQGFQPITGGNNTPWQSASLPAIGALKDGSTQILITATDGTLYHRTRYKSGTTWTWSAWSTIVSNRLNWLAGSQAIAGMPDGSGNAQILITDLNGVLYHAAYSSAEATGALQPDGLATVQGGTPTAFVTL